MNTETYFDSSLLVKLYHIEPGSAESARLASSHSTIPLSFIAEIELRNTLQVLHGRGVLTPSQLNKALFSIDQDIQNGTLNRLHADPIQVESIALHLSASHSSKHLSRTLDILHVSNALATGIKKFATSDRRQSELAVSAGLELFFIELPL